ncbi:MAG: bifunctional folylpolyglutamate synthase/dihydrofolate synthase, partial [Ignavibacteria bacterium]|nr:bifunctional folylpolyglutamate synthase/dihydrofolate synthase [Ignavibacteria bacterium]
MNYKETLDFLYSLQKVGIKFGLENTKKLLEKFDNPQQKFKSIHIAGTNGKGSTASFTASILKEFGYKVGLYTSPHLVKFNERININGELIDDDSLVDYTNFIYKDILEIKPTFFEVTTAIALKYFADMNVDYTVLETGLGGRLDSTNVVLPKVSVITSIGKDHQQYLGSTLEEITQEKGGIIKSEIPVVIGKNQKNVKEILKRICEQKKTTFYDVEENFEYFIVNDEFPHLVFKCKSSLTKEEYFINSPLYGNYQINNIINAVCAVELISDKDKSIKNEIEKGIINLQKNFKLQGRFQIINHRPWIILDTAHNSQAIKFILAELEKLSVNKKIGVFGIM